MKQQEDSERNRLISKFFIKGMDVMKGMRKGITLAAALVLMGASVFVGCSGLSSSEVPGLGEEGLTVEIVGTTGYDTKGNPSVRANGRDSFEIKATVRGLSSFVGFYLTSNIATSRDYGVFVGGTVGTDGYTYYTADKSGVARAVFVTSVLAGRADLWVRSGGAVVKEIRKEVMFDFTDMIILPRTATLTGQPGSQILMTARGALPPVQWDISHPELVEIIQVSDISIYVRVKSNSSLEDAGVTVSLTALDSEGNMDSAFITVTGGFDSSTCDDATLTASPASVDIGGLSSIVVVDADRAGDASVEVQMSGLTGAVLTLPEWNTPGVFQTLTPALAGAAGDTFTFNYVDIGTGCVIQTLSTDVLLK